MYEACVGEREARVGDSLRNINEVYTTEMMVVGSQAVERRKREVVNLKYELDPI